MRVPIDRTQNDPATFVQLLDEYEGRALRQFPFKANPKPTIMVRDERGRFIPKEKRDV